MSNSLAKKFTFRSLILFALPTIIMMMFLSLYTMVDGIFVSRYVGANALSAVNIVYPLVSVVVAVGIMLATGTSAVLAKKMGEGKMHEAKENFTLVIIVGALMGLLITLLGLIFIGPMLLLLGATEALFSLCYEYVFVLLWFVPMAVLQMLFQTLFVTDGKPGLGLFATAAGGLANIVLDYLFIVPFGMGIAGAALATGIGYTIPAVFGFFYFSFQRKGPLHFVKPTFDGRMLLKSCTNGSSEMVTNLSTAVTTYLFNILMLTYMGENGVASVTIVLYAQFLLTSVYLGYSTGVAPVISYNYGCDDRPQLRRAFKISLWFIGALSVLTFLFSVLFASVIVTLFTPVGSEVFAMTVEGFHLFSYGFLFMGINIFASAFFTAFSNGRVSALLSFLRTFVFIVLALLFLPKLIGVLGVWLAMPLAELLGMLFSVFFLAKKRKLYHYT